MPSAVLLLLLALFAGSVMGWGIKHLFEQQQRRKMREILQQEAQRPFSSGMMS